MSEVFRMELSSPITDEQWAIITDAELERTGEITFNTPSGKKVVFIKKPTIDAVEVVRCEDCRHWVGKHRSQCQVKCKTFGYCDLWEQYVGNGEKFFCAYGERRETDGSD